MTIGTQVELEESTSLRIKLDSGTRGFLFLEAVTVEPTKGYSADTCPVFKALLTHSSQAS